MAADLCGLLKERVIILDGAMGTMLQSMGMATGQSTEWYGVNNPDVLQDIHYNYIEAGADIIETNTFGANRLKLDIFGLGAQTRDINMEAVNIAKKAAGGKALVAGSIGPTGQLLKPMGTADYKKLFSVYSEQVQALAQAGVDLISIETMLDIGEMKIASIAVKQNTRLPIIAHMTFEQENRSMTGTDPLTALIIMEALQPLAFGANCSGGAKELLPVIEQLRRNTNSYLTVEPNAGLPYLVEGETFFPDTPEEMAEYALRLYEAGANIIGGCCGTTPQHIQAMARALKGVRPKSISHEPLRALASRSRTVVIAPEAPLAFIGERINPTARKQLAHDIKDAKMKLVVAEAKKQVQSGAPILDINMGVPGVDEPSAMSLAVALVQNAVDVPISIDSTNAAAIEEGLQNFVGRALINSTTGEQKSLEKILPLAQQYGAAVLGLCIDENGIPKTQEKRLQIAQRIYDAAKKYGLRDQDIYIDCLVQTASAEQSQIMETLQSVSLIKSRLQVGIVLGISNVSHGLPVRENINAVFLSMALAAGLDLPIINPFDERIMDTCRSAEVILNRDPSCLNYIRYYGQKNISSNKEEKVLRHIICS
ncbi:MAG: homocysteine S-methyltransferase family protein, partial [Syntrophomonadaceae bacterium]|nr:homocysteine S-methyltransferase family protein [Syntrophomonadaceae bacterium]